MPDTIKFGDLNFLPDYSGARREDGSLVTFTRVERLLLIDFTRHAGALRTRSQLLDAATGPGSDASDRNVDFAINRLRAKLGDSAREPRFIATRYGEGYVWIARRATADPAVADAFLAVGPLRGLDHLCDGALKARAFADALAAALRARLARERRVAFDPDMPAPDSFRDRIPEFGLEITFIAMDGGVDAVATLRRLRSRTILLVRRDHLPANCDRAVGMVADAVEAAIFRALATEDETTPPALEPLAIRVHSVAESFEASEARQRAATRLDPSEQTAPHAENWRANEQRLRRMVAENPDDPVARLMLATNIHNKYIHFGWRRFLEPDRRREDEDEIEALALGALPAIQGDPQHALAAAKLLVFVGRGHRRTAADLAETAAKRATALAHALPIVGGLRSFQGDFEGALGLLVQARALGKPGTDFDAYVTALICQALMASGDAEALQAEFSGLGRRKPLTRGPLGLMFASPVQPAKPPLESRLMLRVMSVTFARAMLLWSWYVSARLFSAVEHRENALRGMLTVMRRRFGDAVVADEIAAALPGLMSERVGS